MLGNLFTYTIHLHGTLAANATGNIKLPVAASLISVAACGSNANNGLLDVGTSADRDGILSAVDIGDSNTPTEYDRADWDGALATAGDPYHFDKGSILAWDLDYDGASGTAAANVTLTLTFLEG
ncbi:MAG: hypothetical protein E6Q97_23085 [Desulfurellales bacterium]|nr:MAG: hypothetical protein E6Q97_23085 [Desulfurellales bacterium]